MAESSFPFENADTTEEQYSRLFARLADNGVASGLTVSASGGMNLDVAIGSAIVQGFFYENTISAKSLVVPTASGSYPRKDYVLLRLDLSANSVTAVVKSGTADVGGGTLPTLTQTASLWEYPIAVVTVPAGAVSLVSANIENWLDRQSSRVFTYASTAQRSRIPVVNGDIVIGINTASRVLEIWNGTSWVSVPELTWNSISGKPTTFTPSAHTHPQSDVVGLDTTLSTLAASKANAVHTHVANDITDQGNLDAGKISGKRITVQSTAPSSPSTGDLWFW
jgi:hypothetical protein